MKQNYLETVLRADADTRQVLDAVEQLKAEGLLAGATLTTSMPDAGIGWIVGPRRTLSMMTAQRRDLRAVNLDVARVLGDPALASLAVHFIEPVGE